MKDFERFQQSPKDSERLQRRNYLSHNQLRCPLPLNNWFQIWTWKPLNLDDSTYSILLDRVTVYSINRLFLFAWVKTNTIVCRVSIEKDYNSNWHDKQSHVWIDTKLKGSVLSAWTYFMNVSDVFQWVMICSILHQIYLTFFKHQKCSD